MSGLEKKNLINARQRRSIVISEKTTISLLNPHHQTPQHSRLTKKSKIKRVKNEGDLH